MISDYGKWAYCPSYKIFSEPEIIVWGNSTTSSIYYDNLVNIIEKTDRAISRFYGKFSSNNTKWENELFFMIYNTLRINVNELYKAHLDFSKCESNKIEEVNIIVYYLFFGGLLLIGIVTSILLIFICWIERKLNFLWKVLHKKIKHNFSLTNSRIKARIDIFHDQHENTEFEPVQCQVRSFHEFNHSFYYIYKLSFFLIMPLILYFITVLIFQKNLKDYLLYRVEFNDVMLDRKVILMKLAYFTIESVAAKLTFPITSTFQGLNIFSCPSTSVVHAKEELSDTRKVFFSDEFKKILTENAWEIVYTKNDQNDNFLKYGMLSGFTYLTWEANGLVYGTKENAKQNLGKFIEDLKKIDKTFNETANVIDSNSNSIIDRELSKLLSFSIVSIIILSALTIFYYYPYFTKEQEFLKKLENFIRNIPDNDTQKSAVDK
ncbi:hypothetical protein SteCoe_10319 [Stentor coeruleus]|uniref:Uncharacterized protein n=1 Tax=Stentor coeruleus TaxID=5963 RepID=A0A1R2CG39_9CILI|nr:hypothetical protein SteCoe_10319 [Stentor coeruleus]